MRNSGYSGAIGKNRFRAGVDDLWIIPLVAVALVLNKVFQFLLSMLIRLLDYAFPVVVQLVWLPLFAVRLLGNVFVMIVSASFDLLPVLEKKRREWRKAIRRTWSWLRRRISYRAFEQTVHDLFEGGMAWVFRRCRGLTPNAALLVILGAVLWLPISFAAAMVLHAVLIANVGLWPAWTQLLHPLATIIAKSKLLVIPVYPAAWPQAKKHPLVKLVFRCSRTVARMHAMKKINFRYHQAEVAGLAAVQRLERSAGIASVLSWFLESNVAERARVRARNTRLRSYFSRWSLKFSAKYYEEKDRKGGA